MIDKSKIIVTIPIEEYEKMSEVFSLVDSVDILDLIKKMEKGDVHKSYMFLCDLAKLRI